MGLAQSSLVCLDTLSRYVGKNKRNGEGAQGTGGDEKARHRHRDMDKDWSAALMAALQDAIQLATSLADLVCVSPKAAITSSSSSTSSKGKVKAKNGSASTSQNSSSPVLVSSLQATACECRLLGAASLCCGALVNSIGPKALPHLQV